MKTYIPLKTAFQEDDFTVGFKAAILSHLEKEFSVPFSLVLTSDVFFEFISYNTLGEEIRNLIETPLPPKDQARAFVKLSHDFEKASFPGKILSSLREAFELLTLDANNLQSLSSSSQPTPSVLSLRRSLNYEDQDDVFSGLVLTRSHFEAFLKAIKSVYLSAFLPSSIQHRREKKIKDFSIAIVISKLPDISSSIEVLFDEDKNTILIESYFGFLDPSKKVPRDSIEFAIDFLKVTRRENHRQRIVSVFDMASNRPSTKQYLSLNTSSQSLEEPRALEIARLTKKIQQALQHPRVRLDFATDKHGTIYLLDVALLPLPIEEQKTLGDVSHSDSNENDSAGDKNENNNPSLDTITPVRVYDADVNNVENSSPLTLSEEHLTSLKEIEEEFEKDIESFEKTFYEPGSPEHNEFLSKMIVGFLSHYRKGPFKTEVEVLLPALLHNPSQGMLLHGLGLCRDIVRSWTDA